MRVFLTALTSFFIGALLVAGLSVGLYFAVRTPASSAHTNAAAMPHMAGSMSMSGSTMTASSSLAAEKLTIVHVQRGCHVWSHGTMTGAMMRLHLKPGQKLSIVDMDVDPHQLTQLGGPMHVRMGGPMMTNKGMTLSFPKKGVYRLATHTVDMPGGGHMDVKTIGPDNHLRLVVTVA